METEIETIELENGKLYAKVTEVVIDNIKYFFLVNSKDTYDYVIRKEVGEEIVGLDNNEEFEKVLRKLLEDNKISI